MFNYQKLFKTSDKNDQLLKIALGKNICRGYKTGIIE
jgi:hypothetical protein